MVSNNIEVVTERPYLAHCRDISRGGGHWWWCVGERSRDRHARQISAVAEDTKLHPLCTRVAEVTTLQWHLHLSILQPQPSVLHLSQGWTYLFHIDIRCLLHVMLKVQVDEPQVSQHAFLNVTHFWQLGQYCIILISLYQKPGVLLISVFILQSRSSPDSCVTSAGRCSWCNNPIIWWIIN